MSVSVLTRTYPLELPRAPSNHSSYRYKRRREPELYWEPEVIDLVTPEPPQHGYSSVLVNRSRAHESTHSTAVFTGSGKSAIYSGAAVSFGRPVAQPAKRRRVDDTVGQGHVDPRNVQPPIPEKVSCDDADGHYSCTPETSLGENERCE
ncbi:hypothetical protein M427DRAFT_390954 [Gonapodya prolifera JEL478]|uniref:Uncharacterized protein n=1 Tax=Gonapodya prolifera (strain JEL478) TaxID=1344416 RepID=A0A139A7E5_GONPJ|nr:hypothetical protein M427DRAFT_390954 [Gonapodya prolifera JEL478]|eukprot:KXS12700.1 hypothetical protein M427DRAFT_390954 [Gonapodya prolifera JEL478]